MCPGVFNYARDVVDAWAGREPNKVALVAVGPTGADVRRYSFADLARNSNRSANLLQGLGVSKGDRVFLMLPTARPADASVPARGTNLGWGHRMTCRSRNPRQSPHEVENTLSCFVD